MQNIKRWSGIFFSERALSWWFFAFLIFVSILRIGYYPGRVMHYDQHVSGPFMAQLVAFPHFYEGSFVSLMRPFGVVTFAPCVEALALRLIGLDPLTFSYFITLAGNVAFVFALYVYAKLYLNTLHAMSAALLAWALQIDWWNLSNIGNLQVFPTATDLASATVILAFTALLRERWFLSAALLAAAAILHPVYALFAAISCALTASFGKSASLQQMIARQGAFGGAALIAIGLPLTAMALTENNVATSDYFLPLLYGVTGHANAWLKTDVFFKALSWLTICTLSFMVFSDRIPKLAAPLFWCTFVTVISECILQWVGITYQLSYAAPLGLSAASRCSMYVAFLAFPLLYRGIIVLPLTRAETWHPFFKLVAPALCAALLIFTYADCWTIGKASKTAFLTEEIKISRWMQTTPEGTRFLTVVPEFEQNSFSLRPAIFPLPYFISFSYRIRDEKIVKFDQDMVQFWGPPKDHKRNWLDNYWNDIQTNRMLKMTDAQVMRLSKMFSTQYLITTKTASQLSWPLAFETDNFKIYKLPHLAIKAKTSVTD